MGAAFDEALATNPQAALSRFLDEQRAAGGMREEATDFLSGAGTFGPVEQFRSLTGQTIERDTPLIGPEEATERAAHVGLTFDRPIPEAVLARRIELKEAEAERQAILARARGGVLGGTARLTAALVASAIDPINIGSAFVPVVREARFASWAARYGSTPARLARGAVEGAAGAALVEPIVLGQTSREGLDYDLLDSLLNVTVGTALGGGLHAAGGAFGDAVARSRGLPTLRDRISAASLETREAALRSAVAQAVEGRQVEVEPVLRTDARYRDPLPRLTPEGAASMRNQLAGTTTARPDLGVPVEGRARARFTDDRGTAPVRFPQAEAARQVLEANPERASDLARLDTEIRNTVGRMQKAQRRLGVEAGDEFGPIDDLSRRSVEELGSREGLKRTEEARRRALRPFVRGNPLEGAKRTDPRETPRVLDMAQRLRFLEDERQAVVRELGEAARRLSREGAGPRRSLSVAFEAPEPTIGEDVMDLARRGFDVSELYAADVPASRQADAIVSQARKLHDDIVSGSLADLDDSLTRLEEIENALGIDPAERAAMLAEADEVIAEAQSLGRALRAAVACTVRT